MPPAPDSRNRQDLTARYPSNTEFTPTWPANLVELVKKAISTPCFKPDKPELQFELTAEAAAKNWLVFKKYSLNVEALFDAQSSTPMRYGSEFRDPSAFESIFSNHPNWLHLERTLRQGSHWYLTHLDDSEERKDLDEAIEFGNHKGADNNTELLTELVAKDVEYGYAFPVPLSKLPLIPGAILSPVNIAPQHTINELGQIIDKDRLTQNLSYEQGSGTSVNSRVIEESLLTCPFAHALRRFINTAVALRNKYPGRPILCSKIDYKSAFRRLHLNAKTAVRSFIHIPDQDLALMFTRLPFGGKPCPSEWGALSETTCDLANALLSDPNWNPEEVFNPQSLELPPPKYLPDEVEIADGRELVMQIPVRDTGHADIFIDDTFALAVDLPGSNNVRRLERAILLAIHVVARPLENDEPIPRAEMAARNKFVAEAGAEEQKMILGWFIDFRRLMIHLPKNKHIAWGDALRAIIESQESTAKELEKNIGRCGHISVILPEVNHFLNRLRSLHKKALHRRKINIPRQVEVDCQLLIKFLDRAHKGISLNNLVFRMPDRVYRSDSCPRGLGGYSDQGYAWRYYLPKHLQFRASNNVLEHIASIITVWIDIIAGRLAPNECILSMTDSSTSEGWAHKSNFDTDPLDADCEFDPEEPAVRSDICRKFASLCLDANVRHYSQWFPGKQNDVSDALSRDDDRSDEELTNLLYLHVPEQMPKCFEIVQLPKEIVSWLTALLLRLPVKKQLRERHTRTKIGRSADGSNTQNQSASDTTSSSMDLDATQRSDSWERLPWLYERGDFRDQLMTAWLKRQSEVPSHMYHRPSGTMIEQDQPMTKMESLDAFYQGYSDLLERKIQRKNNRKQSQQ